MVSWTGRVLSVLSVHTGGDASLFTRRGNDGREREGSSSPIAIKKVIGTAGWC